MLLSVSTYETHARAISARAVFLAVLLSQPNCQLLNKRSTRKKKFSQLHLSTVAKNILRFIVTGRMILHSLNVDKINFINKLTVITGHLCVKK